MKFFASGKRRWWVFLASGLIVASAGLYIGKLNEGKYIQRFYTHTDFMLLDSEDNFFRLRRDLPEGKMLLIIFTPDGLDPEMSIEFRNFSSHLDDFRKHGVEVMMLTRTNREIAKNFKAAAHFHGRLLLDPSGTVGRLLGIWPDLSATSDWGYAFLDRNMQVFWRETDHVPLSYEHVWKQLQAMK